MDTLDDISEGLSKRIEELKNEILICSRNDNPYVEFYNKFRNLCYRSEGKDGILLLIAKLLKYYLADKNDNINEEEKIPKGDYSFWINYSSATPYGKKILQGSTGRMFNENEISYLKLKDKEDIEIQSKADENNDLIAYYFFKYFNENAINDNKIIAIQRELEKTKKIQTIYARKEKEKTKDADENDITFIIREHNKSEPHTFNSIEKEKNKEIIRNIFGKKDDNGLIEEENDKIEEKYDNYVTFLKKVFNVNWKPSEYYKDVKDIDVKTANFEPNIFAICNLSDNEYSDYFGTIIIGANVKVRNDVLIFAMYSVKSWLQTLNRFDRDFHDLVMKRKLTMEQNKTAIAAIMSRNMSHNLGSHLITNTKNYISRRADSENDADLRGIAHLLQYIQERMDFIATVVSGDIYPLAALNVKSQIFDELTIDDKGRRHGKKTNNFLLEYLASSEKYTHYHEFEKDRKRKMPLDNCKELLLQIEYPNWKGIDCKPDIYTGLESMKDNEKEIQLALSKLNLAVPQGIMARHAFFSIIENIIRNAAKHAKGNKNELRVTIRFEIDQTTKSNVRISIYDNQGNAEKITEDEYGNRVQVVQLLNNKLNMLKIINENGEMDKNDKGLKEILVSVLWLKNINISKFFSDFEIDKKELSKVLKIKTKDENLMYEFTLPVFETETYFEPKKNITNYHADVIIGNSDAILEDKKADNKKANDIFTRYFDFDDKGNVYNTEEKRLKYCIEKNLFELDKNKLPKDNIDNYKIRIDTTAYNKSEYNAECQLQLSEYESNDNKLIVFKNHFDDKPLDEQNTILKSLNLVPYIDSISGENFTSTVIKPDFLNDSKLRYKVIESALTKITIIDERIFSKFYTKDKQHPENMLNKRGIYIYTVEFDSIYPEIKNLYGKNINIKEIKKADFLTIHLALLEKWKAKTGDKIPEIMNFLEENFVRRNRITIHSGRGNFSEDLNKELKGYPFITLSGIEAVLYDSKYQLSQLFYNTIYYGKGNINHNS